MKSQGFSGKTSSTVIKIHNWQFEDFSQSPMIDIPYILGASYYDFKAFSLSETRINPVLDVF